MACEPQTAADYTVRVFDAQGVEWWRLGTIPGLSLAAEVAESVLVPGQHARIYDAAGEECGRVYPGEEV